MTSKPARGFSDKEISDSYIYLLGRLVVTRQQQLDFQEGFVWGRPGVCGVYGDDYLSRTCINYGGTWANVLEEVFYYKGAMDGTGMLLHSDNSYTITFPPNDLPSKYTTY